MADWNGLSEVVVRNATPLFLSLALPATLFVCRSVVRSQRSGAYQDLMRALYPHGGDRDLPQLELVRSKYAAHSGTAGDAAPAARPLREAPTGERPHGSAANNRFDLFILMLAAMLFAAFSFLGFALLLTPKACLFAATCGGAHPLWVQDSLAWSAVTPTGLAGLNKPMVQAVTVAAVGFLGAYVATTQFLIRQLLNYELGAVSFLRAAFQLFLGLSAPLVAFRALAPLTDLTTLQFGTGEAGAIAFWIGTAFFIGLAPQAGISWIGAKLKLSLEKRVKLDSLQTAKIIPLEIIDGIDSTTRFRLDEANITDVQNLATRNPIELYVETPYSLLQVFDWVLQAQLCLVVGADAFEKLRKHRVRTIFDLERAVLADGAPEAYITALGEVIFSTADPAFRSKLSAADGPIPVDIIRHSVAVMCDDLHVHRLRALWKRILVRSADADTPAWLYRTGALPGDEDFRSAVPMATGIKPVRLPGDITAPPPSRHRPPANGDNGESPVLSGT